MKRIAITGGLACGKSSVCHFLEELGAFVVSADSIVHQLLSRDLPTQQAIVDLLGESVKKGNSVDRSEVAKRVFANPELLSRLERLLHPEVQREMQRQYEAAQQSGRYILFVAEIPLLFEAEMEDLFDETVAIVCDQATSEGRYGRADFALRSARQLTPPEKAARADHVIVNQGTLSELKEESRKLFERLIKNDG